MTIQKRNKIDKRLDKIKIELMNVGDIRPGSLTKQYRDPTNKKGAYYQLSYTLNMKSKTERIKKDYVSEIEDQIKNYKYFKKLTAEWVSLSVERSKLSMKL